MAWIRVGDLLVADDATTAAQINTSGSLTRAALDGLYDKTAYASQAAAQSGTASTGAMSPLRTRQAFDAWIPGAVESQIGVNTPEIALFRFTGEALTIPVGTSYVMSAFGTVGEVDPHGIVTVDGGWLNVARDGLYQLSMSVSVGRTTPEPVSAVDTVRAWWALPGFGTSVNGGYGVTEATKDGVVTVTSTPPPVALRAGQGVAPLVWLVNASRPFASEARTLCRVSIERLGPMIGWPTA